MQNKGITLKKVVVIIIIIIIIIIIVGLMFPMGTELNYVINN